MILSYIFLAAEYHAECIIEAVLDQYPKAREHFKVTPGTEDDIEAQLMQLGAQLGYNFDDEGSYDSDEFPKRGMEDDRDNEQESPPSCDRCLEYIAGANPDRYGARENAEVWLSYESALDIDVTWPAYRTPDTAQIDVERLSNAAVATEPLSLDWSEGYGERFDYIEAVICEHCEQLAFPKGEDRHSDCPQDHTTTRCTAYVNAEGPMMNYFYPIDGLEFTQENAAKIADLSLCLVELSEERTIGLALTGGGMDMTWSIIEAHVRLGYLPPTHFGSLPRFAGTDFQSGKYQTLIRAMQRSLDMHIEWLSLRKKRIDEEYGVTS